MSEAQEKQSSDELNTCDQFNHQEQELLETWLPQEDQRSDNATSEEEQAKEDGTESEGVYLENPDEEKVDDPEDLEHPDEEVEGSEEEFNHLEADLERQEDDVKQSEEDLDHQNEDVEEQHSDGNQEQLSSSLAEQKHSKEEDDMAQPKIEVKIREAMEPGNGTQAKVDEQHYKELCQKLPPLCSYLITKRRGKMHQQQQPLEPKRVLLEAGKLLPRLRQSQSGIGYYARVLVGTAGRSSRQPVTSQPAQLALGPSPELTDQFYNNKDSKSHSGKLTGVKRTVTAASVYGHYPFSRIIYPNLIGQSQQPISLVQQRPQRSYTSHSSCEGTFVLRHKMRQSAGCLARIMDSSSTGQEAVKRAISRAK